MEIALGILSYFSRNRFLLKLKTKLFYFAILLVTFLYSPLSFAQDPLTPDASGWVAIPNKPEPFHLVNDYADILSIEEEKDLEDQLSEYEKEHRIQLVVLTTKTTGNSPAKAFAQATYETWNLSYNDYGFSLLLLVAADDKASEIGYCYSLEPFLSSINIDKLIKKNSPHFYDKGKYYGSVADGLNLLISRLPEYNPYINKAASNRKIDRSTNEQKLVKIFFSFFCIVIIMGFLLWLNHKDLEKNRKYKIHSVPGRFNNYQSFSRGSGTFGGGGYGGSSGDGGFGGFGGGSSGGGGASGSW